MFDESHPAVVNTVASILSVQRDRLDVTQILGELTPLAELKEDASIVPRLKQMLRGQGLLAAEPEL